MPVLFTTLLFDARQHCDRLLAAAGALPGGVPAVAAAHFAAMRDRLVRFRQVIEDWLGDPDCQRPELAKHSYIEYKRISEFVQAFEERTLLVLGRFSPADEVATKLLARICMELGFPYKPPLCSTLSAQYFWADPGMDVVFIPPCESSHLLGLADLYHELAHFVMHRERQNLMVRMEQLVDEHFAQAQIDARRKNWPRGSVDALEGFRKDWRRSWLLEFACDVFATFCAGSAYGWCNVRLCSNLSEDIVASSHSHPADEARARIIDSVLRKLGFAAEADGVKSAWHELVKLTGKTAPQQFDLAYPPALLASIVEYLVAALPPLGVKPHTTASSGVHVTGLLNDAWQRFLASPTDYAAWEAEAAGSLQDDVAA